MSELAVVTVSQRFPKPAPRTIDGPMVAIDGYGVVPADDLESGTYTLVSVTAGATVTAEKKWWCYDAETFFDVENGCGNAPDEPQEPGLECGWVTVVSER